MIIFKMKKSNYYLLAAIVLVTVISVVGLKAWSGSKISLISGLLGNTTTDKVAPSSTWAVFLTNGQTYFGNLDPDDLNGNYVNLSGVYYLERSQTTDTSGQTASGSAGGGYNLVHLGSELHGPMDKMLINRMQVLMIEQLKSDSKVVKAIESLGK